MNRTRFALCALAGSVAVATAATGSILALDSDPAAAAAAAAMDVRPATVSVRGTGVATADPDVLRVTFAVTRTAKDVSAAIDGSNARVRKVKAALRSSGVAAKDIRTEEFDVGSNYSPRNPGYRATQTLSVTLRNLAKAGRVIADAAAAGGNATRIYGVSYAVEDRAALVKAARDAAFADARAKAQRYAELAGKQLGPVRTVSEGGPSYSGGRYQFDGVAAKAAAPAAARSSVPLSAGSERVSVTDKVVWELN